MRSCSAERVPPARRLHVAAAVGGSTASLLAAGARVLVGCRAGPPPKDIRLTSCGHESCVGRCIKAAGGDGLPHCMLRGSMQSRGCKVTATLSLALSSVAALLWAVQHDLGGAPMHWLQLLLLDLFLGCSQSCEQPLEAFGWRGLLSFCASV